MPINTFVDGAVITAASHNENWALAVLCDTSRTITVTHTWSASQTFTAGLTVSAGTTAVQALTCVGVTVSGGTSAAGAIITNAADGLQIRSKAGSSYDFALTDPSNNYIMRVPTGGVGVTFLGGLTATTGEFSGTVLAGAGSNIGWTGRSLVFSPADGQVCLTLNAGSDFGRLQFGGTTSSFPALKRSSTAIHVRLADDSGYAPLLASNLQASGDVAGVTGTFSGAVTADAITATGNTSEFADVEITGPLTVSAGTVQVTKTSQQALFRYDASNHLGIEVGSTGATTILLTGASSRVLTLAADVKIGEAADDIGFYGATPAGKPTITGSRGGNAALADLLTELAALGLITDSTS